MVAEIQNVRVRDNEKVIIELHEKNKKFKDDEENQDENSNR